MIFQATKLPGVFVIEMAPYVDERGYFACTFCAKEFEARGLCAAWVQCNTSFNHQRGTLRGLHYQVAPHEEVKLVRCTRGAIFDVALDLRADAGSYLQSFAVTLTAANRKMLYVPKGCAHGYLTLEDESEVSYQVSEHYAPEAARGIRWDDPIHGIDWPIRENLILSQQDSQWPTHAH